jgi:amino acid transporter
MTLSDWLFGPPLPSNADEQQKISVWGGLPVLGLDGLSSAAYGPEAALTLLLPLGVLGIYEAGPIITCILVLLGILYFSYRQTIHAYPNGGGSYIVASANLGRHAGLFAAAALMVDYILTVAVGISSGVGALISMVPTVGGHDLHKYILPLCLVILVLITIVNLRGLRESSITFGVPTYLFIVSLIGVLLYGVYKVLVSPGHHPVPVEMPPAMPRAIASVTPWLLLRAFASGCTAMTGVEAVSNGVQAFSEPRVQRAQKCLTAIIAILAVLLGLIAYLCSAYHVGATDPDSPQYQSVLSMLISAIVGRNAVYYVTLGSVVCVLALSANTGFADFPRLCHLVADDRFLPHLFAARGRRLVFTGGILVLAIICALLLIAFGGITDRLIPLFAIGAFLAFTLSQAGMVEHWRKNKGAGWKASMAINLTGGICTGVTLCIVLVAKFVEGAWITVLLIPSLVFLFSYIGRHYQDLEKKTVLDRPIDLSTLKAPYVVTPVKDWSVVTERALRFSMSISPDVLAVHVDSEDADLEELLMKWHRFVEEPANKANATVPKLQIIRSPYRRFIRPVIEEVEKVRKAEPDRIIAVVIPEIVETGVMLFVHNQRANMLKTVLLFSRMKQVVVIDVPWYSGQE